MRGVDDVARFCEAGAGGLTASRGVGSAIGKRRDRAAGGVQVRAAPASRTARPGRCGGGMLPPSGGAAGRTRLPGGVGAGVEVLVVAVAQAALAREAGHAALELVGTGWPELLGLVARLGVRDLEVHERHEHVVRAGGQRARLAQERHGGLVEPHEVRDRLAQHRARCRAARPRTSAARAWRDERQRRLERRRRMSARPAARRARTRAATAAPRSASRAPGCRSRSVSRSAGTDCASASSSRAKRARGDVEVRDEVLQRALVLDQRGERLLLALAARAGGRWFGSWPSVASLASDELQVGRLPVLDRLVEALGAAVREALRVLLQEGLQVGCACRAGARSGGRRTAPARRSGRRGSRRRSSSSPPDGEPGWRSTKKLPSRKMRGRIFSSASFWIGRPLSSISIVTSPRPCRSRPARPSDLADLDAGDPHRRLRLEVVRVVEDGLELVRVRERVRLREAEVARTAPARPARAARAERAHAVVAPALMARPSGS